MKANHESSHFHYVTDELKTIAILNCGRNLKTDHSVSFIVDTTTLFRQCLEPLMKRVGS